MQIPIPGSISSGSGVSQRTLLQLQSQGTRLYTAIHYRGESGLVRIFASQDHGATWNLADAGLYAADHNICDFVAAPDSTTLYATTGQNECFGMITSQSITLWRSDDAGAHWNRIGQLPGSSGHVVSAFKAAGRSDYTLYVAALNKASLSESDFRAWASEDNGRTWKAAPTQNGQQSVNAFLSEPRDGSLIQVSRTSVQTVPPTPEGVPTATTVPATPTPPSPVNPSGGASQARFDFAMWRPGQTDWRQIAQSITGATDVIYTVESVSQTSGLALWAVTASADGTGALTYSVRTARLS